MRMTMNMMLARRAGLALVLGLPILMASGCPTGSALLDEGVNLIREISEDIGEDGEGTTSSNPTDPQDPAGDSESANDQEDADPPSSEEPPVQDDTPEQPAQDQDDEADYLEYLKQTAQQIQQALGGKRLTYLTSQSNDGNYYTSHREDHDLCSSGQFQIRIVDQSAGYGNSSEDVYESSGTWRIVVVGTERVDMEVDTQQSSSGYTGVDQYPIWFDAEGELYINGFRYNVTSDNPLCN